MPCPEDREQEGELADCVLLDALFQHASRSPLIGPEVSPRRSQPVDVDSGLSLKSLNCFLQQH